MSVIIDHLHSASGSSDNIESSLRTAVSVESVRYRLLAYSQSMAACKGCKSVKHVVFSGNAEIHMDEDLAVLLYVESGHAVLIEPDVPAVVVAFLIESEGDHVIQTVYYLIYERIRIIGDYQSVIGNELGKSVK